MISARMRQLFLLFLLMGIAAYVFATKQADLQKSLQIVKAKVDNRGVLVKQLDERTVRTIERYIDGVKLDSGESSINHAISLDHQQGRPAINKRDYQSAYKTYQKIIAISYNHANLMGLSIGLMQIATVQRFMGESEAAIELEQTAYKISEAINDPHEKGVAAMRVARALESKDRLMALKWRLKARSFLKDTPYKQDYIYLLQDLAKDYRYIGKDEAGYKFYETAFKESQAHSFSKNDLYIKYYILKSYIQSLYKLDKCPEIIHLVDKNLPPHGKVVSINEDRLSLMNYKSFCLGKLTLYKKAKKQYLENYYYYSLLRVQKRNDKERAKFDKRFSSIVNNSIQGLLESKEYIKALVLLESNKATTLNEILGDESYKKEYELWVDSSKKQIAELYGAFNKYSDEDYPDEELFSALRNMHQKHSKERLELQLSQSYRTVLKKKVLSKADIDEIQSKLDDDTVVLSYFVGNDKVSVFVIDAKKVQHILLNLSPRQIKNKIRELQMSLQNPVNDYYIEPSLFLYQHLVKPLEISDKKNIVYIPDNILSVIPFGVLNDGNQYLTEQYNILRFPSLRYFKTNKSFKKTEISSGISCVDPEIKDARLPFQLETGEFIKELYGNSIKLYTDKQCNIGNIEKAISKSTKNSFLHVGAHGYFYTDDPMQSGIFLTPENNKNSRGYWNAQMMATSNLSNFNLVSLSSCETGVIDTDTPRDVFGIIRALYYAGAKNIIAPLWSVEQEATSKLMKKFYKELNSSNNILESMSAAKKEFIQHDKYKHPFYWAAFINVGGA